MKHRYPKRGEIWLCVLDPTVGCEINKTRPSIVISCDINNEFADTITILPVTTNSHEVYPFEVRLLKEECHLPFDSKVKCNQIRTIDKSRLIKFLCSVSEDQMKLIVKACKVHLAIL